MLAGSVTGMSGPTCRVEGGDDTHGDVGDFYIDHGDSQSKVPPDWKDWRCEMAGGMEAGMNRVQCRGSA